MRLTNSGINNERWMLQRYFWVTLRNFWIGILSRVRATEDSNVISAAGDVSLDYECHRIDIDGADNIAGALADGVDGQHVTFVMVGKGGAGNYVLTPSDLGNRGGAVTKITFSTVGQSAELVFMDGTWWIKGTPTAVAS